MELLEILRDRINLLKDKKGLSWDELARRAHVEKHVIDCINQAEDDIEIIEFFKLSEVLEIKLSTLLDFNIDLSELE